METGTIKVKTKEDLEKLIRKKLKGYHIASIDYGKGNSGRVWVKIEGGEIPEGSVGICLFQFFVEK